MSKKPASKYPVGEAWTDMVSVLNARSVMTETTPRLVDYALGRFDPKATIERLLDPEPTYFAHKEILLAGLCAWTVCPHLPHLTEEAMVVAGAVQMAALERRRQSEFPQDPLLADITARLVGPGIDFYRDFYYPAGGLSRIVKARSPALMKRSLRVASKDIGFIVELMRISHYHAVYLQDRQQYRTAAQQGTGAVIEELLKGVGDDQSLVNPLLRRNGKLRRVNGLNAQKYASPYKKTAALIYGAYTTDFKGTNLLSHMCSGEITYKKHSSVITEWLGRSVFAATNIIEKMFLRKSITSQVEFLPILPPFLIDVPDYGALTKVIKGAFARNIPVSKDN